MAFIQDDTTRIIKANLTIEGKKQFLDGRLNISFYSIFDDYVNYNLEQEPTKLPDINGDSYFTMLKELKYGIK